MPEAEGKPVDFLIKRLRENRKGKVTVGKFTFTYRRPTDREAFALFTEGRSEWDILAETASRFVVDWEGVSEDDVVGGGGSDAVAFDELLWKLWIDDRRDLWQPIAERVQVSYREHQKSMEDAEKK